MPATPHFEPEQDVLRTHGDTKYRTGEQVAPPSDWDGFRVEHRLVGPGAQVGLTHGCTELVYILSGQARVKRTGDGVSQEGLASPGTSWLVPAGTHETQLELEGATECLMIFLPETLLARSALMDYDLDPDAVRLSYLGGMADPDLALISRGLHKLSGREDQAVDRMKAEGLRTLLAAHLIGRYSRERPKSKSRGPALDPKRLRRVLDYIEGNIGADLSISDLAAQACLSPYHFARLFQSATGSSPHRYLTHRRVLAAQARLRADGESLAMIAHDLGFGSQANFTRVFRKATGVTPGQFRGAYDEAAE